MKSAVNAQRASYFDCVFSDYLGKCSNSNWPFSALMVALPRKRLPSLDPILHISWLREEERLEREWNLEPLHPPYLRDGRDGWLLALVTGIMGFASLAFPTNRRYALQNEPIRHLTTQLISIHGILKKSNFPLANEDENKQVSARWLLAATGGADLLH